MREMDVSKYRKMVKTLVCAVAVLGIAACVPVPPMSAQTEMHRQGAADARADFAAGFYRLETYGVPPSDEEGWKAEMKQKYGIHIVSVAGCGAAQEIVEHAEGYNQTMIRLLKDERGLDLPF